MGGLGHHAISCEDLQMLFDLQADPWMHTSGLDNGPVVEDVMRSKLHSAPVFGQGGSMGLDDVLVLRLTRMARSAEVTALLLGSPVLEECRLRMAGYDITPPWAGGAKLLVP